MTWIKTVAPQEATGVVAGIYRQEEERVGFVRESASVLSLKPRTMQIIDKQRLSAITPIWYACSMP